MGTSHARHVPLRIQVEARQHWVAVDVRSWTCAFVRNDSGACPAAARMFARTIVKQDVENTEVPGDCTTRPYGMRMTLEPAVPACTA